MEENPTTKIELEIPDNLLKQVQLYQNSKELEHINAAIVELINESFSPCTSDIIFEKEGKPNQEILNIILNFRSNVNIFEQKGFSPLLILLDKKSGAYYCECHILAEEFIKLSDTDATIDPDLQEEFRANRELEPDNVYFQQMVEDAKGGRQFSDIIIEYNLSYAPEKPLKILGGQHRTEAIKQALAEEVNRLHGIKVYFNLTVEQRAEIMRVSNTNINVSPDLRDRIEEQKLSPANMLRDFCYKTNLLKEKEDFGDKRRTESDFSPVVRMIRTFVVDFFKGLNYVGDIDKDAVTPYLCDSGATIDPEYLSIFNQFKKDGSFNDDKLVEAAKNFSRLHSLQFEKASRSNKFTSTAKRQYKIKAFSYSIISSWAFAAGVLQKQPERLNKLYQLPELSGDDDPLNALAMSEAKHKNDSDTYRGLGTRTDKNERGRILQLFLNYSNSDKQKITKPMCVAAIELFHANLAVKEAEEKRRNAF